MNLNLKEEYTVFRALLYNQIKIGGADKLLAKLMKLHPEWQHLIDEKEESNKRFSEFRKRVLGY